MSMCLALIIAVSRPTTTQYTKTLHVSTVTTCVDSLEPNYCATNVSIATSRSTIRLYLNPALQNTRRRCNLHSARQNTKPCISANTRDRDYSV